MSLLDNATAHLGKLPGQPRKALPGGLPVNLVADVMNRATIDKSRVKDVDDFNLHVSGLINKERTEKFCGREAALHFFSTKSSGGRRITPGFDLLFKLGHSIHDHVRDRFIQRSEYRDYVWGVWSCPCGHKTETGYRPIAKVAHVCKLCRQLPQQYVEYSLYASKYRLVGHPDLIFKYDDLFYLYEIKTIDRKDVDFDTLDAPLGDHVLQGSMYYWLMRNDGMRVAKNIRYVYVDRSNAKLFRGQPYKEFRKEASPIERLQPFLNRAKNTIDFIKDGRLPPRVVCDKVDCTRAKACARSSECFNRSSNRVRSSNAITSA